MEKHRKKLYVLLIVILLVYVAYLGYKDGLADVSPKTEIEVKE